MKTLQNPSIILKKGASRREFLKAVAATGVCAMASSSELFAQRGQYEPAAKGGCTDGACSADQYLFGTDFSPEPIESTVNEIPGLGMSRDVQEMLERKNAERLFPRFKA